MRYSQKLFPIFDDPEPLVADQNAIETGIESNGPHGARARIYGYLAIQQGNGATVEELAAGLAMDMAEVHANLKIMCIRGTAELTRRWRTDPDGNSSRIFVAPLYPTS